jgi:hypothetical protein
MNLAEVEHMLRPLSFSIPDDDFDLMFCVGGLVKDDTPLRTHVPGGDEDYDGGLGYDLHCRRSS